jgi:hypothetical protein
LGGHLSYALGGAFANDEVGAGLRQNLDLSFLVGSFSVKRGSQSMGSNKAGWMAGPMGAIGFGAYPTYVGVEAGFGADASVVGWTALVGPIARVDPGAGGGTTVRLAADLFLVELGLRAVAVFVGEPEFQVTGMIGVGRY